MIYIGVTPNNPKEPKDGCTTSIVMEFNPNKINPWLINDLLWLKNVHSSFISVMSFDLALDMDVAYSDVRMLKRDVREKFCKIGKREVETYYLGEVGHNHVKLYNKAKEQKIDIDWTRFEITCKKINSIAPTLTEFEELIKLPTLYRLNSQIDFDYNSLRDIERVVLESIISDIQVLYSLKDSRARKKYEQLLSKFLMNIDLNIRDMYSCYIRYINSFFSSEVSPW